MMQWKVPFFKLNYDTEEQFAVQGVVSSGWLSNGKQNLSFEKEFETFTGLENALTLHSCTAALQLALILSEVGPGDEVILPALNFVAAANMILALGAKPVFIDVESAENLNSPAAKYTGAITKHTKAIIVLHFAGFPNDISEIYSDCRSKGVKIIEDCAHAPGGKYAGLHVGAYADFACFSFFANKNLPIGEGGMLCCKSQSDANKARYLRSHGMTANSLDKHKGRASSYNVVVPGFNHRMDEIRAALGRVQLQKLANNNCNRTKLVDYYRRGLASLKLTIPFVDYSDDDNNHPVHHILPVILPEKTKRYDVIEAMKSDGIATSVHYPSFASFDVFSENESLKNCQVSEFVTSHELTLPLFPSMIFADVDIVLNSLGAAL